MTGQEYESICKANASGIYIGDNTVLCRVLSKHKMYVNASDVGIAPHLMMDGYWESWLTQLLARIIKPGDICLDIGANFGYYSILMSELTGDTGKTISIEPNPAICEMLRTTAFINGNKFEVVQAAISDKAGEATLTVTDRELGGGTIKPNELIPGRTQVKVKTLTVDELVQEHSLIRVDVVKVDVEGMEPVVLAGMEKTIADNPDIKIVIEYSPSIYNDAAAFTEYIFREFEVHRIKDVENIERLNVSAIPQLLRMTDHTDLYLRRKNVK
jgi:FkbM family methyltransferase